jgi:hypothetical protein
MEECVLYDNLMTNSKMCPGMLIRDIIILQKISVPTWLELLMIHCAPYGGRYWTILIEPEPAYVCVCDYYMFNPLKRVLKVQGFRLDSHQGCQVV